MLQLEWPGVPRGEGDDDQGECGCRESQVERDRGPRAESCGRGHESTGRAPTGQRHADERAEGRVGPTTRVMSLLRTSSVTPSCAALIRISV